MPYRDLPLACEYTPCATVDTGVRSPAKLDSGLCACCNQTRVMHMPGIFHLWLAWLPEFENKTPATVRAYSQGLRRVVSYLVEANQDDSRLEPQTAWEFDPGHLNQAELTDLVRDMRSSGEISRATLGQTLAALKSFYDFCIADGLVGESPDVKRIRKVADLRSPRGEPEFYTATEVEALYSGANEPHDAGTFGARVRWPTRDLAMLSFLATLGLRSSELIDAEIDWITPHDDPDQRILRVKGWTKGSRRALSGRSREDRKTRQVPLSSELVSVNESWQIERGERFGRVSADAPLFVTNTNEKFNYRRLRYWLLTMNRAAGVSDRSLHALRHTAGVEWAAAGTDMNEIMYLLGHSDLTTTSVYVELAGLRSRDAIKDSQTNKLLRPFIDSIS